jgi:hypothetical protein
MLIFWVFFCGQSLPMPDIVLKAEKMKEILSSWMIGIIENFSISFQCRLAINGPF